MIKAGIGKPRKRENGKMRAKPSFNKNCWLADGPNDDGQRALTWIRAIFPGQAIGAGQGATAPR
jgi:hypothetical protein